METNTLQPELINTIHRMFQWNYRSIFQGYQTDCPHRKKNGWSGDSHLIAEVAMYRFQNLAGYEKWLNDFKDA